MKNLNRLFVVLMTLIFSVAAFSQVEKEQVEANLDSTEMSINQVPARILDIARKAKTGIFLTGARRDLEEDDDYYYVFDGTLVNRFWTIVVRADGELIEVSEEGEAPQKDD